MSSLSADDSLAQAPSPPEVIPAEPAPMAARTFWRIVLVGALAAGFIAWGIAEFTVKVHVPPKVMLPGAGGPSPGYDSKGMAVADSKNAVLTYAITGLVFGLISGVVGGLCSRSPRAACFGGILGAILGGSVTMFVTKGLMRLYFREVELGDSGNPVDLFLPFAVHACIGASLATTSAVAFAMALGARGKRYASIVVSGLVGGVIGALIYEASGALIFPLSHTDHPIAKFWAPRLIGMVSVALAGMISAAGTARSQAKA